ncbi:unnamed protein product [Pylaiella littoralis]
MRDLGELFEEAPSVESYPEYHLKVKNIMDLNTIREKVVDRKYTGVQGLVSDVALMYSNAQAIKHEQATKDGEQLLRLARATVDLLEREAREGTSRKHKLNQQAASTAEEQHQQQQKQQQQPAAVFGDGLRISCAKCSRVRRDPPGRKPSKACTKKERYWFCEPCVTGSPEAFSGRGIGVCRRDGKWKLATVRGYEPLSGKHEVVYRGELAWEFLALGDPVNHIRYCQPVPPASLSPEPQTPIQQQPRQENAVNNSGAVNTAGGKGGPSSPSSSSSSPPAKGDKPERGGDSAEQQGETVLGTGGSKDAPFPRGSSSAAVAVEAMGGANGGRQMSDGCERSDVDGGGGGGGSGGGGSGGGGSRGGDGGDVDGSDPGRDGGEAYTAAGDEELKTAAKRKREDGGGDSDVEEAKRMREGDDELVAVGDAPRAPAAAAVHPTAAALPRATTASAAAATAAAPAASNSSEVDGVDRTEKTSGASAGCARPESTTEGVTQLESDDVPTAAAAAAAAAGAPGDGGATTECGEIAAASEASHGGGGGETTSAAAGPAAAETLPSSSQDSTNAGTTSTAA